MFDELPAKSDVTAYERAVGEFWTAREIFQKSLAQRRDAPTWVFYEGPPTANGKPHHGHVLTRVMKDLFPRYKTMCGFYVPRKAGWDTHGLPVEIEVEKELGLAGKPDIETYGVEAFVKKCQESVFVYMREWEELTKRIGFWIDLSQAYVTFHTEYIESVWWALKTIHDQGLLYRGHKVLPWCPRDRTVLSAHEVSLGYKTVQDPSITIAFRSTSEENVEYLAWTTTPWTLISNVALTVDPEIDYAYVKLGNENDNSTVVLAAALVDAVLGKLPGKVEYSRIKTVKGAELLGQTYEPLFTFAPPDQLDKPAWKIIPGDFVTLDAGTGIVHTAPAYGADDQRAVQAAGLATIHLVKPDGTFCDDVTPWKGRWVKDADKEIIQDLKRRKRLLHWETYEHNYPHCWRCDTPLLYFAREAWFIRTTERVSEMLANNAAITWKPDHIRTGRFGKFLETNVDWALSRERYWGTPLPIWICDSCGHEEVFASLAALEARNPDALQYWRRRRADDPSLNEHLVIHKPFVDHIEVPCEKCGGTMKRVPEVIDCWFDSGAMPFAQWGYPHRGKAEFERAFPADWITEAIDQTRGWFYSLLAVGTLVFGDAPDPKPYRACMVLGHVCDEAGEKLSKHKKNYQPPEEVLEREGADALRWFFYSSAAPWKNSRFSEQAVREGRREFLLKLREITRFFVTYANIDGFDPAAGNPAASEVTPDALRVSQGYRPAAERGELDRWILSELQLTIAAIRGALDDYDCCTAARKLQAFVDALSNWYLRRSRRRFWGQGMPPDKIDAYWTLYEALVTTLRLAAPFTPFIAEDLYQRLVRQPWPDSQPESVHLTDYPQADETLKDDGLSIRMNLARELVQLGHAARASAKLRVRQPLKEAIAILPDPADAERLAGLVAVIAEELNVKRVAFAAEASEYVHYEIKANFKLIGPKYRADVKAIKTALAAMDGTAAQRQLANGGKLSVTLPDKTVELSLEEVDVRLSARAGYVASEGPGGVVVLNTELDEALIAEGLARDINNRIQNLRRELELPFEARIRLALQGAEKLTAAARAHGDYIQREALADELAFADTKWNGAVTRVFEIAGEELTVTLARV